MRLQTSYAIIILLIAQALCFGEEDGEEQGYQQENKQVNKAGDSTQLVTAKYDNVDSTQSQPMRIVFNFDSLIAETNVTNATKTLIMNSCLSSGLQIANLLKVNPRKNPIVLDQKKKNICFTPKEQLSLPTEVDNADLYVYVSGYFDNSTTIAKSVACFLDKYPLLGRIFVNHNKITAETIKYSNDQMVKIFTHELTHILGFSRPVYVNWINPSTHNAFGQIINQKLKTSSINNVDYKVLTTVNSQEQFQTHFKCQSILGVPLEQSASKSHFPQLVIRDEIMDSNIVKLAADLTQFTMAVYKDTGFYTEINENMFTYNGWGYEQGCEYFSFNNSTQTQPQQQLNLITPKLMDSSCDPSGYGKHNNQYLLHQKNGFFSSTQTYCSSLTTTDIEYSGEEFSNQSKCFGSSISVNTVYSPFFSEYKNTRCYKTVCNIDGTLSLKTSFGSIYKCEYPSQRIDVSTEQYSGYINCPSNLSLYCNVKLFCKNGCSLNGFCLKGICVCRDGFGGEDCSSVITTGHKLYQNNVVTECPPFTYLNPNNVCMPTCLTGYYINGSVCSKCDPTCSQCTGPDISQCTACNMDYLLLSGHCFPKKVCAGYVQNCFTCVGGTCTSCKPNHFLTTANHCQKCSSPCEECSGKHDFCLSCQQGYILQGNTCVALDKAMPGCQIFNQNNPKVCLQCSVNYFLDKEGACNFCEQGYFYKEEEKKCLKCSSNCQSCIYEPQICTSCQNNYFFNIKNNLCIQVEEQQSSRLLKAQAQNTTQIQMGENDFFFYDQQQYMSCHYSCQVCSESDDYSSCLVCSSNRIFTQSQASQMNFCVCPQGTSDYGQFGCFNDDRIDQIKFAFLTVAIVSLALQFYRVLFEKGSLVCLLVQIDFLQSASYLRFINRTYQGNLDEFLRSLQFINIFNYQVITPLTSQFSSLSTNPKFMLENKTYYFFSDTLILFVILATFKIVFLGCTLTKSRKGLTFIQKASLVILCINFFAIQEVSLNISLSINFFQVDKISILHIIFGFVFLNIIAIQSCYIIISRNQKIQLEQKKQIPKQQINIQNNFVNHFPASNMTLQNNEQQKCDSTRHIPKQDSNELKSMNEAEEISSNSPKLKESQFKEAYNTSVTSIQNKYQSFKQLMSLLFLILSKIAFSAILCFSYNSPKTQLIVIGSIYLARTILVWFNVRNQDKKIIAYAVLKQIQFIGIIAIYSALVVNYNGISEIVLSGTIVVFTFLDSLFSSLFQIISIIIISIKGLIAFAKIHSEKSVKQEENKQDVQS